MAHIGDTLLKIFTMRLYCKQVQLPLTSLEDDIQKNKRPYRYAGRQGYSGRPLPMEEQ